MKTITRNLVVLFFVSLATASITLAQEEKKLGWADTAEVSYVATGGNAKANTLGLRNLLTRTWENALFNFETAALRASTGTILRSAVGTPESFDVTEETISALTAENYLVRSRYDRTVSGRLVWYVGGGWDRNAFAGIQNRYEGIGGLGHVWFDEDSRKFRTTYGISFVHQEDVVLNPNLDRTFAAARLSSDYFRKPTGTTEYVNKMIVNQNLQETSDLRFDMVNSIAVALSSRLALKVTHQVLFDNLPSLEEVSLTSPTAGSGGTVLVPLQKFDTVFNVALVIGF